MTGLKLLLYRLYGEVNTGWKHIRSRRILLTIYTVCGTKFLREFVFADWRFFCFAGTNFATRTDWGTQYPALTIFSFLLSTSRVIINYGSWVRLIEMHILKQYYGVRQYFFVYRFVSERKRQVVREGTFFIGGGGGWAEASEGRVLSTFLTNWGGTNLFYSQPGEGHSFFGQEKNHSMSLLFCIYQQSYQSKLI